MNPVKCVDILFCFSRCAKNVKLINFQKNVGKNYRSDQQYILRKKFLRKKERGKTEKQKKKEWKNERKKERRNGDCGDLE